MKVRKVLLAVGVSVVFGLAAYYFVSSETTEAPRQEAPPQDSNTIASMEGFKLIDQEFDRAKITITARRAALTTRRIHQFYRLAIGNVVEMDGPSFVMADPDGGQTAITGNKAVVDPAKKEVVFEGGCLVMAPDGAELRSELIVWKYARGYLDLKNGYTLKKGGHEYKGDRLTANLRLSGMDHKIF